MFDRDAVGIMCKKENRNKNGIWVDHCDWSFRDACGDLGNVENCITIPAASRFLPQTTILQQLIII